MFKTSVFCVFLLLLCTGAGLAGPSKDIAKDVIQSFNSEFRTVRPDHLLLPVNYLEHEGHAYGYSVPRRFSRLAQEGERFRVRKFKVKSQHIMLELESESGARLKIQVFDKDKVSQLFLDEIFPAVLQTIFDFGPKPEQVPYVGHTQSHLMHLGTCNHLPPASLRLEFATIEDGETSGFTPCKVCFPRERVLPYEGYSSLRMKALEEARIFELAFPPVDDHSVQADITAIGEKILAGYPIDPVGFDYEFTVVHSALPISHAVKTGFIFVTDSLLEIIEHPAELEFVLAQEIANCELNLPPVASMERSSIPPGLGSYFKNAYERMCFQQTTADLLAIMYLARTQPESVNEARTILAKLQFAHEAMPVAEAKDYEGYPTFSYRLKLFDEQNFQPWEPAEPLRFEPHGADGVVNIQLLGKARSGKYGLFYLLVEGSDLLNKPWDLGSLNYGKADFATIWFADGSNFEMLSLVDNLIEAGEVGVVVGRLRDLEALDALDPATPVEKLVAPEVEDEW